MNTIVEQLDPTLNPEIFLSLINPDFKIYKLTEANLYLVITKK